MKRAKKHDPEFMELLTAHVTTNESGDLKFSGLYAAIHVNIPFKGGIVSMPNSHIVWLLTHGRWPRDGMVIDHIDHDATNDAPDNLQELTPAENQKKRRGRIVNRKYGTGKYGNGMGIYHDQRDLRFYVTHTLPRAAHKTLKTVKKCLGGFSTLAEAEAKIVQHVAALCASFPGPGS